MFIPVRRCVCGGLGGDENRRLGWAKILIAGIQDGFHLRSKYLDIWPLEETTMIAGDLNNLNTARNYVAPIKIGCEAADERP